jgi:hypothetical protein
MRPVGTEVTVTAAQLISPRRESAATADPLRAYLLRFNGADVLEFADNHVAREAADALRARSTMVSVEARYNKVILKIKQT